MTSKSGIIEIANQLGISVASVSRAINQKPGVSDSLRKKILNKVKELGYEPDAFASGMRSKKSRTIGLLIPRIRSDFFSRVIAGIESVLRENSYKLIIAQSNELLLNEKQNLNTFLNHNVDGVLACISAETREVSHFDKFNATSCPVVYFDRYCSDMQSYIGIDNQEAGYQATISLLKKGKKRIAYIGLDNSQLTFLDRYHGYLKALAEYGITSDPELHYKDPLKEDTVKVTMQHILKSKVLPDGIFAATDTTAAICIKTLKANRIRVPEDVSVVGINNDFIADMMDITTIEYDATNLGKLAARQLINQLNKEEDFIASNTLLTPKVIHRKTVE